MSKNKNSSHKKLIKKIESLEESNKHLRDSNSELTRFSHMVAHDLKAPLRSIELYNYLIRRHLDNQIDDDLITYFKEASLTVERMRALIDGLLDYSDLSKNTDFNQTINVTQLVDSIKTDFKADIEDKNASIIMENGIEITGNKGLIRHVFANLISNAIKYSRSDIETCQVDIKMAEQERHWKFSVVDNGIGIDQRYHETIFKAFERLHNRADYEGRGLGLDLCKKIVEQHQGKIWVDSTPAQGSCFQFTICKHL